jgi:predicted RNA-binding protein with PUA-like domain
MAHWLVKSEPSTFSWERLAKEKRTRWDGIRNHQAANNLKAMKKGERVFFYHSNEGLAIVGIAEVAKTWYPDPSDQTGRFGMVDLAAVTPLKTPVTLAQIREDARLNHLALVKNSRLSVQPVDAAAWQLICKLGGVDA